MLPRAGYWICAATIVLSFVKFAQGQGETTSAIVGSVTDPTGAAISGATVTVTNVENGLKRSVKTDDAGTVQLSATQARHVLGEGGGGPV